MLKERISRAEHDPLFLDEWGNPERVVFVNLPWKTDKLVYSLLSPDLLNPYVLNHCSPLERFAAISYETHGSGHLPEGFQDPV